MIPQNVIDDILSRVSIVDIIGRDVELKRAGKNYTGLCPFHREKTPSFSVNEEKGFYHCFGCKASGNALKFLMEHRKMAFREALEELAVKAGVDLSRYETSSDTAGRSDREKLFAVNREAVTYYHKLFMEDPSAQAARDYLKGRGLSPEIVREFRLGYGGNGWDGLLKHLRGKGFKDDEIERAAVVTRGEKGLYDRFRERVLFPIFDKDGNPVGFGGRVLDAEAKAAKYINTAESTLFHKGSLLFGLNSAKDEVIRKKACMIVEGYMDALACYQHGIRNVVAPLGTALTENQLILLKRYAEEVLFVFDGDGAGIKAANRALDVASKIDLRQTVAVLRGVKDPCDFLMSAGPDEFRKYLASNRMTPIQFKLWYFSKSEDAARDKVSFLRSVFAYVTLMESAVVREDYLKQTADYLGERLEVVLEEYKRFTAKDRGFGRRVTEEAKERSHIPPIEARFAALAAAYPAEAAKVVKIATPKMLEHPAARALFEFVLDNADKSSNEILSQTDEPDIVETAAEIMNAERASPQDVEEFAYRVRLSFLKREHEKITGQIAAGKMEKDELTGLLKMQKEIAQKKDEIIKKIQNLAVENA